MSTSRSVARFAREALPRGRTLPEDVWRRRHRGIQILLWLHVPVLFGAAMLADPSIPHAVFEAGIPALIALMATAAARHPTVAMVMTSVGLMTCSAEFVHLTDGLIEMHFHYFVMVGVITLYQHWQPFLIAIGYVVVQHGVAGAIAPEAVYNHPDAIEHPWRWAAIHGAFILAMSATGIINWRLNESLLGQTVARSEQLDEAQRQARIGSWELDLRVGVAQWSEEMYRLFGVDAEFPRTRPSIAALVHDDDRPVWAAAVDRLMTIGQVHDMDYRIRRPNGECRWVHSHAEVIRWADDRPVVLAGTVQDITERRGIEDDLRASRGEVLRTVSLLEATLDSTADGILVVDRSGQVSGFNHQFLDMWNIPLEVIERGDHNHALQHVLEQLADPEAFLDKVRDLYARPQAESFDPAIEFADGRVFERQSRPQRVDGEVVGRVWSFRDVTERTRLERELNHRALHDPLTGLGNQVLFRDRLDHALERIGRSRDHLSVLFIDLDDFKTVNDSLGHKAGDELLVTVAARIQSCLRTADTAARLGGDEFVILLEDLDSEAEAEEVAQRIITALVEPFTVGDREVFISASVGIATDGPGASGELLLRNADLAMYAAKRAGKNRSELFAPRMHAAALERIEVETDLRRALDRSELLLHYQPIMTLATGEIDGVEALVRWLHPERGLLGAGAFIPYAEDTDLIDAIGRCVLEAACTQTRRWQVETGRTLRVSVNVAARQLRDPDLVASVARSLERSGLAPQHLVLEITESAMMQDSELALERLQALRSLGLSLAVDDFGTGYSSLSYLQQFPIDVLKIDRSFVDRLGGGPEESALARAIVHLARSLRLTSVAEGVETEEQLAALASIGCDQVQGFHLHPPMDAAELGRLLGRPARCEHTPSGTP